jgi:hypothetical protein
MEIEQEIELMKMAYSMRLRLYYESRINDAARIFSWIRKPSAQTMRLESELKETCLNLSELESQKKG